MISSTLKYTAEAEAQRIEKLHAYHVLDTHPEDNFDNIALMAAQIFDAPDAIISFVDTDRIFLKSNLSGLPQTLRLDRHENLCGIAVLNESVTVFNDTHQHPDLLCSPLVNCENGIRFYAGAPLRSPEGYNMGMLCVTDTVPRQATKKQLEMLKSLSKLVIDKLENRLRYRKNIESQVNLMSMALHEIKNPLASINLANDIILKDPGKAQKMGEMIKSSVMRIQNKLSDLLKQSQEEEKEPILAREELNLMELFVRLLNNFELLANKKQQIIELHCQDNLPSIYADKAKISDVLHNLVSNAIKYSYKGSVISIDATEEKGFVKIMVKDEGQGLSNEDMSKLFTKFAVLSSKPTGKETSNGLGLSITKSFVELHNGTIEAVSAGKDRGTTFIVKLPVHRQAQQLID
ncbi:GAF domain-containing sensor histidine kinase [Flavobacterium sp. D11R37]|uniref:GAF domain-containing sensor histidine kinase n=1 Tax=Flavobacterium coralii TaxID=2838017 RepID=UPI001CA6A011|nr:GAF domain-containing sensor histidine kinase [Flavobacterium coralii]MBY8961399.1 GAF domain-containing sensor histidine kinase [Flavobacterium coralii]